DLFPAAAAEGDDETDLPPLGQVLPALVAELAVAVAGGEVAVVRIGEDTFEFGHDPVSVHGESAAQPDREFAGIRAQQFLWGRRRGFRGFGGVLCAERDEEQHQQQVSKEPARQVDRWNPTAGACAASGQDHESSSRPPTSSSFRRRVTSCCTVLMKKASSSERAVNSSTARRKVLLDCSVKAPSLSWAVASSSETRS